MGSFIWRTLRGDILRVAAAVAENKEIEPAIKKYQIKLKTEQKCYKTKKKNKKERIVNGV